MSKSVPASLNAYKKAVNLLQNGDIVALPTETVYGIAGLADNSAAIETIYTLKNRPKTLPLSICIFDPKHAQDICEISPLAKHLMDIFWPGPLTLVLPQKAGAKISKNANSGLDMLGLRCPDTPWRQAFLGLGFKSPIVLTSANTSGKASPTTATTVMNDIGDKIPMIIDGGPTRAGVESTIIAIHTDGTAKLLRTGAIRAEDFAPFDIQWGK